ncbi:MAG: CDP-6-deoxy-delta-3,4-glucoseen reductase [Methylotenera sp. 24-45-7]|jgi:CDP-4-dehydro-6-deoxyglucose reductase|nr:MAG: CDP-6-deoxy-delta-3,4-glucoseen reductase [Mehylophilales bacterium 35-46-6]OYZ41539.1 MAG: CDP-6-deoxy-delta-3,4-glucoseen reductase [Methylotenera sp. 24-45-7]OZA08577.1 MAG: CDP-6-deoxy-delta-3,4-glucoseen reductase [Methylotenera sp. 17-45-7]OZA53549.1 MAG: CDP-6-deoxy-delta-3,4-glucoseen reductase [Methylophilales bacterium 39-45-7]HQS37076.1 CDP-6-deoxy-delta-3,4-glucoseen reductase [Methylotenera sp.]
MSYQITIQPSGHVYDAKAYETVLESAIEAGFNIPYGCRNGACGSCKGTILSGEVDYGDYARSALSEDEKEQGKALFCCARPLSDLTIECREIIVGTIPPRILPARVEGKKQLSHDVMALYLKLPSSEHLQFLAGQYIEFLLKDGKRRAFSLANAPHADNLLEFHLRLIPGGVFTEYVFNEMPDKAIMRFEGPFGSFYYRDNSQKPMIMVAGGTGFAPIKGIVEHMLHHNIKRDIVIYWGARALEDLYMPELPQAWAEQHEHIKFIPVLSDAKPEDQWQGRTGLVHQAVLDDMHDLSDFEVYCCGAPAMVEVAHASFQQAGLPEDAFYSDAFNYAKPTPKVTSA